MQKLQRVTLTANAVYEMTFDVAGSHFLVKNFGTNEDNSPCVYVSLCEQADSDNHAFKILSGGYQEIFMNDNPMAENTTNKLFLKSTGAVEVEVQMTRW